MAVKYLYLSVREWSPIGAQRFRLQTSLSLLLDKAPMISTSLSLLLDKAPMISCSPVVVLSKFSLTVGDMFFNESA